jgi:hypothetical protein
MLSISFFVEKTHKSCFSLSLSLSLSRPLQIQNPKLHRKTKMTTPRKKQERSTDIEYPPPPCGGSRKKRVSTNKRYLKVLTLSQVVMLP